MPKAPNYGILEYKRGKFSLINEYLRKNRQDTAEKEKFERIIADIDHEMNKNIAFSVLYRGASLLEFNVKSKDQLARKINTNRFWKNYVSTTSEKYIAIQFSQGILLKINTNPQIDFVNMMDYDKKYMKHQSNEKEILLKYGTSYKITQIGEEISQKGIHYFPVDITLS